MLSITDISGNDLQVDLPAAATVNTSGKTGSVAVYCVVTENDPELYFQHVSADLDWNDGTQPVHVNEAVSPLVISTSRTLRLGTYAIKVTAQNNRAPVPDTASVTFMVTVKSFTDLTTRPPRLYGPILPRDTGNPSPQTWLFNSGNDLEILASSVKMLLGTSKGERIMQPNYGTNLRRLLFEPNIEAIESIAQQEISQALSQFEPRVRVQTLDVRRDPNRRNVSVEAEFVSNLAAQPFQITLQFAA